MFVLEPLFHLIYSYLVAVLLYTQCCVIYGTDLQYIYLSSRQIGEH